jgi:hypothetical protein
MPISPELYKKYKTVILEYSNAVHDSRKRGLTHTEIAEKLGLEEWEVKEILAVAEKDLPSSWWPEADEFKKRSTLKSLGMGGGRGLGRSRQRRAQAAKAQNQEEES